MAGPVDSVGVLGVVVVGYSRTGEDQCAGLVVVERMSCLRPTPICFPVAMRRYRLGS